MFMWKVVVPDNRGNLISYGCPGCRGVSRQLAFLILLDDNLAHLHSVSCVRDTSRMDALVLARNELGERD